MIFPKRVIYQLKRDYGVSLELYRLITSTVNLETGIKVVSKVNCNIKRAILLPRNTQRLDEIQHQLGSPDSKFRYGGFLDKTKRVVLIDSRDIPITFEIQPNDYCIINEANRYNVQTIDTYDNNFIKILTIEEVKGESLFQIIERTLTHDLQLGNKVIGGF